MLCLSISFTFAEDTAGGSSVARQQLGDSPVHVELRCGAGSAMFAVQGLSCMDKLAKLPESELQSLVQVHVHPALTELPSVLGSVSILEDELVFITRFPLSERVQYRIDIDPTVLGGAVESLSKSPLLFSAVKKPRAEAPGVVCIYPTMDVLPENILKFYIHFSAPMNRGEAYSRIHLMQGKTEIQSPFLELDEELWDAEQKRFTLLIHPGRIKRGVKPREDSGLPMTQGNRYSLHIDADWTSANNRCLSSSATKTFSIGVADERQPVAANWIVTTPKANTKQAVQLKLDEPLDHAMLERVTVVSKEGKPILGDTSILEHETLWTFTPLEPWLSEGYSIVVSTTIEDLAGNSLARAFETLPDEPIDSKRNDSEVAVAFNPQ